MGTRASLAATVLLGSALGIDIRKACWMSFYPARLFLMVFDLRLDMVYHDSNFGKEITLNSTDGKYEMAVILTS